MADGGILPWRVQTIDQGRGPTTTYASVHRSLPKPPAGLEWVRNSETKEWSLKEKAKSGVEELPTSEQKGQLVDDVVTHKVSSTNTIQGICIKYGISAVSLKKANRFSGNSLVMAPSTLKIPVTDKNRALIVKLKAESDSKKLPLTQNQKVSALRCKTTTDMSVSEAKAYLELHDWDLDLTMDAAKRDMAQEKQLQESEATQEAVDSTPKEPGHDEKVSDEPRDPPQSFNSEIELAGVPSCVRNDA